MRAGVAAMILVAVTLSGRARGQSGATGTDVSREIRLHPDVMTVLQLPDKVERAQLLHDDELQMGYYASRIYVQPRPDTPAGVEAFLEVETRTMHRLIKLRVVARAEDAMPVVEVRPEEPQEDTEGARQDIEPEVPAVPEPAASAPSQTESPHAGQASVPEHVEPIAESRAVASSPRFDLAVHAFASLGVTALEIGGYQPTTAFQPHRAAGVRLTGEPHDSWWGMEASLRVEWLAGPMSYEETYTRRGLAVTGPWLQAEVDMRMRHRRGPWILSASAGLGAQAHLRRIEEIDNKKTPSVTKIMESGVVLALGMGLQYQGRDVLLGVDFQLRQGGPDDYRSISVLWIVGYRLPEGD